MKAYVMTTGTIFGLLVVAHIWRMIVERAVATDPFYIAITIVAAGLSLWAWRVLKVAARS